MKKFFALMVTVAMLLVAGSAMAADFTILLSSPTVSIQAGGTPQTVTVTSRDSHPGGRITAVTVSGADGVTDWVTASGTTITVSPDKTVGADSYSITVRATETYTYSAAGHTSIRTADATATLNVTVTAASAGTTIVVKIVDVVTEATGQVEVISNGQNSVVVQDFAQMVQTVTTAVSEAVRSVDGYDGELAITWGEKGEEVDAKTTAAIQTILGSNDLQKEIFGDLPEGATVTLRDNQLLVKVPSSTIANKDTVAEKLAAATAKLLSKIRELARASVRATAADDTPTVISVSEAMKATASGTYSFNKVFGKDLWGVSIYGYNGLRERVGESVVPVDGRGVAFLNSSGDVVTAIPDASRSKDIMPGFVRMLVVMEAGRTYEPLVYTTGKDLADKGISTSATTVTYKVIKEEEKEVVVTVDEHGNVTETVVETASADVVNNIASAMGVSSVTLVPTSACAAVPEQTIKKDDSAAAADSVHVAARTVAFNDLPNGAYYFPITFKSLGVGVTVSGDFEFYPDGYSVGTTAFAMIFDAKGNEITDPASVLAATSSNVKGYIAFEIENGGIRIADANNTLANPTVGILVKAVTPTPTPTSDDAVLNDLVTKGYVRGTTITDAGFAEKVTFSGTVYTGTVKLNFPVQPSSWTVSVAGNGSIKASAIGAITNATSTQATITLNKAEITAGTHAVTLSVLPTNAAGTVAAKTPVTASLGSVVGNPGLVGVGSSSGGCSAGSAVLALALLGVFIARKK